MCVCTVLFVALPCHRLVAWSPEHDESRLVDEVYRETGSEEYANKETKDPWVVEVGRVVIGS